MEIKRVGSQASIKGPDEWFTGAVRIDPLFLQANTPSSVTAASVTFEPCARTAWHSHPLGQMLQKISHDVYRTDLNKNGNQLRTRLVFGRMGKSEETAATVF